MDIPKENIFSFLKEPCATYEGKLQAVWHRVPLNTPLKTVDGKTLVALSRGEWNLEAGPDFKNAKISIDGKVKKGDIEVHVNRSDWFRHRHSADPSFKNIILHAVGNNDCDSDGLDAMLISEDMFAETSKFLTESCGKCSRIFYNMPMPSVISFFRKAGFERAAAKSDAILANMITSGIENAFLKKLFEVCGAKRNKSAFLELFSGISQKYTRETFKENFEPVIWGESGLLPVNMEGNSEAAEKARSLWEKWWRLRGDSGTAKTWQHAAMRPLNTPEREIAALAAFIRKNGLNPLPEWHKALMSSENPAAAADAVLESFRVADNFWENFVSFGKPRLNAPRALIGESKMATLAADCAVPALLAYIRIIEDKQALRRLPLMFEALPFPGENKIIRTAAEKWFPDGSIKYFRDAAAHQGIHHIYGKYCSKASGDCEACLFYRSSVS